jgi:hypothetical protein
LKPSYSYLILVFYLDFESLSTYLYFLITNYLLCNILGLFHKVMLWYGKSAIPSPDKILNRNSHRYLKSDQKKLFTQKKFNPSPLIDIYFYFPCDWKVNLLTNPRPLDSFKIVYASSTLYYYKVILPSQTLSLYYSISTGNLSLRAKLPSPLLTLYFSTL